jgi:hypothetical protein
LENPEDRDRPGRRAAGLAAHIYLGVNSGNLGQIRVIPPKTKGFLQLAMLAESVDITRT